MVLFLALAELYESRLAVITTKLNVWFGLDIPLFWARWMVGEPTRAHWHPLAFALHALYGALGPAIADASVSPSLVRISLPTMVVNSVGIALALAAFEAATQSYRRHGVLLAATLLLGPVVLLAPVADTHMAGGVFLLMSAVWVARSLRPEERSPTRALVFAATFGAIAAGFSLTNAAPAGLAVAGSILCGATAARRRPAILGVLFTAISLAAVVALGAWLLVAHEVEFERTFLARISPQTAADSFRALVIYQFGVPTTVLQPSQDPVAPVMAIGTAASASWLSVAAFAAWSVGVAVWLARRAGRPDRWFIGSLGAGLLFLIIFHSMYATYEAYMFSPHAWFALVIPAWLVLRQPRITELPEGRAMMLSLACCAAQTFVGLAELMRQLARY